MWTPVPGGPWVHYTMETLLINLSKKLNDSIRDANIVDHAKVEMRTKLCLLTLIHQLQYMTSPSKLGPTSADLWVTHLKDSGVLEAELRFMFGWILSTTNAIMASDRPWIDRDQLEEDALKRLRFFCKTSHDRKNTVRYASPTKEEDTKRTRLVDSDTGQLYGVDVRVPRVKPNKDLELLCLDCDAFQRKVGYFTPLVGTPGQGFEVLAGVLRRPANDKCPDITLRLHSDGNWIRTHHDGPYHVGDRDFCLKKGYWEEMPHPLYPLPTVKEKVLEGFRQAGAKIDTAPFDNDMEATLRRLSQVAGQVQPIIPPKLQGGPRPAEAAPAAQPAPPGTEQSAETAEAPPGVAQETNPEVVLEQVPPNPDVLADALQEEVGTTDVENVD